MFRWLHMVFRRMKEPSTWAALTGAAAAFGMADGTVVMAEASVVAATALTGVFLPESGT